MICAKKYPARMYKSVAPTVVAVTDIIVPHHFPNINPEKISTGVAKPKKQTHTTENKKKIIAR